MIEHVVLVEFKAGVKKEQISELRKLLAELPTEVPEIRRYKYGEDVRSNKDFDFALVSTFDDTGAVKRYLNNPNHIVVGKYIRSLAANLKIIDFEHS